MSTPILFVLLMVTAYTWLWQDTNAYVFCGPNAPPNLCKETAGNKHIVCYPDQVPQDGTLMGIYPSTKKLRRVLVQRHNYIRDKVASGILNDTSGKYFPAASRMRELIWDSKLEYIAKFHAARCNNEHDLCRDDDRFRHTGQNLGYAGGHHIRSAQYVIDAAMDGFFDEKDLVSNGADWIKTYYSYPGSGHLAQLVNDQCTRVGCAIAYCTNVWNKTKPHGYFLTCDYDCANVNEVYKTRDQIPTIDCDHWESEKSTVYPNLCKSNGKIFPDE